MKWLSLLLLMCVIIGVTYIVRIGNVSYNGWDFTPHYIKQSFQQRLRQEQLLRDRDYMLLVSGEDAWRAGDLKTAETQFKAVLSDKSLFAGKAHFDSIARADLIKLYKQQGRTATIKALLTPR